METSPIASEPLSLPPPDGRPHEATIKPGEEVTFYGGITLTNRTDKSVDIRLHFDLSEGFIATIDETREMRELKMGESYAIEANQKSVSNSGKRQIKNINNFA